MNKIYILTKDSKVYDTTFITFDGLYVCFAYQQRDYTGVIEMSLPIGSIESIRSTI